VNRRRRAPDAPQRRISTATDDRYFAAMDLTISIFRRPTAPTLRPYSLDNATRRFTDLAEAVAMAQKAAADRGAEAHSFQIKVTRTGDVVDSWTRTPGDADGWSPRATTLSESEVALLRRVGGGNIESTGPELRPVFEALLWAGFVWFVDGMGWTLTTAGQAEFDYLEMRSDARIANPERR
jgi:hypothetical protein